MTSVVTANDTTARFIVNVEVAVVRDGLYLATTRGEGESRGAGWVGFPGGKLDAELNLADALESTARREVLEEVGLELLDPLIHVESHTFGSPEMLVLNVVMLARAAEGTAWISDPAEVAQIEWLSYDEMLSHQQVQVWTRESLKLAERLRQEWTW